MAGSCLVLLCMKKVDKIMKNLFLNKWFPSKYFYIFFKEPSVSLLDDLLVKCFTYYCWFLPPPLVKRLYQYAMQMLVLHSARLVMGQLIKK